ncbi:rab11 family-interacting protein 3-like isoform X2 [Acipenser ruthenus]|uniref:rab11 family-interacting protein 3-like isoform X2 n=1 Tax=Acipenser ruthenus TaxID=7906 RepID=UPI002741BFD4|nr:rab11 family-interacting protein 3-like isoform X2 [Acipenser ruthenus]
MEQVLLSSPGGHSDWELEQNMGDILKDSPESGLDFIQGEKELVSLKFGDILQENALNLDGFFRHSRYPNVDQILSWDKGPDCPVLQWEKHSKQDPDINHTAQVELLGFHDNNSVFSSDTPSLQSEISALDLEKGLSLNTALQSQVDISQHCGINLLDINTELAFISQDEGFTFSSRGETSLSETTDKGSFQEPVMDLLGLSYKIQGTPLSSPCSPSHTLTSVLVSFHDSPTYTWATEPTSHEQAQTSSCHHIFPNLLDPALHHTGVEQEGPEPDLGQHGSLLPSQEEWKQGGSSRNSGLQPQALERVSDETTAGAELSSDQKFSYCDPMHDKQDCDENVSQGLAHGEPGLDHNLLSQEKVQGNVVFNQNLTYDQLHDAQGLCLDAVHGKTVLDKRLSQNILHKTTVLDQNSVLDVMHEKEVLDPDLFHDVVSCDQPVLDQDLSEQESSPSLLRTNARTRECVSPPSGQLLAEGAESAGGGPDLGEEAVELSPLRAVFDALDQDQDGFVRMEEFVQFATVYGAEQVKDLTRFLDPGGLGVISFEDFYRGITAISNGGSDSPLYEMGFSPGAETVGCPEEYDDYAAYENEVTDSAYLGSESTYSECETFTDEDTGTLVHQEMHEEVETDSAIDAALSYTEEGANGPHQHHLSLGSELNNHSLVTVISGEEEHFEDVGEGRDSKLLADTSTTGQDADTSLTSQLESSMLLSPSAGSFPASLQSFLREEVLDFFCSQCHKQINRLEDLSARLNYLEMNSSSKSLSSRKMARHLHQTSTLTLDSIEDLSRDIMEFAETDMTDKVMFLEKRVSELEKDSAANGEQHTRLRHENLQLVHRANALEEQLKEQESRSEEALLTEIRRQKEVLCKVERERSIEIENLQARLQQLDEENSELQSCLPCLRANIERLEEERRKLQDQVEDVTLRLNEELESRCKMADKLAHERHKNQKENESTQELIEDLRKQLELLQLYKLEAEARRGRSASAGLQEYNSRTREAELEQEVRRLKQDNCSLKEQNDELNGQIINLSIQGAKNLFSASFSESLAAEINSVSRDELMEAIHKQEDINLRLQEYIDRIIVAIMESNPSILEVK